MPLLSFKFVCVFADGSIPLEEREIQIPDVPGKDVSILTETLQEHFAKDAKPLTVQQKETLRQQIASQLKTPMEITDEMIDLMTTKETVDVIQIYPNRPDDEFIGINMYCDDRGMVKKLPMNLRASEFLMVCGKPTQVWGDAFFARVQDDGRDMFARLDFTLGDFTADAKWVLRAREYNFKNQQEVTAANLMQKLKQKEQKVSETKKEPISDAKVGEYKAKLLKWLEGKMKTYDEDEDFRGKRDAQYKSRDGFKEAMMKKAERQLRQQTGHTDAKMDNINNTL